MDKPPKSCIIQFKKKKPKWAKSGNEKIAIELKKKYRPQQQHTRSQQTFWVKVQHRKIPLSFQNSSMPKNEKQKLRCFFCVLVVIFFIVHSYHVLALLFDAFIYSANVSVYGDGAVGRTDLLLGFIFEYSKPLTVFYVQRALCETNKTFTHTQKIKINYCRNNNKEKKNANKNRDADSIIALHQPTHLQKIPKSCKTVDSSNG